MAEKNSTSADDKPKKEPTPLEAMFFFAIVKHTKNKADIDWAGVAAEQGFKSAEVAKVRFGQVKRKLGINDTTTPNRRGAISSPANTPTKVTKTPTKSRGGRQKAPVKKEESDTEDDTKVKTEVKSESRGKSVKPEPDEEDVDPSTQLQADMDAMLNEDPF
ncbi:uncharacterized protein F5Z01DRAFT_670719 [Emericellopsis atlantica]|uniref:Myb-like DNA-binding domain-containing protein n=1 Tax=Emericellopsis atlantica TaxID=2614577 RepID=A0A9P7ZUG9_9HYPO|nr:uncharacterized protein F5Z01DRAFT_670719 [Emericellopsis atlantica]KAG9258067.1 hypothetical protein F5Z01DRAFT_670719 [Emericellopsis atlantica]